MLQLSVTSSQAHSQHAAFVVARRDRSRLSCAHMEAHTCARSCMHTLMRAHACACMHAYGGLQRGAEDSQEHPATLGRPGTMLCLFFLLSPGRKRPFSCFCCKRTAPGLGCMDTACAGSCALMGDQHPNPQMLLQSALLPCKQALPPRPDFWLPCEKPLLSSKPK